MKTSTIVAVIAVAGGVLIAIPLVAPEWKQLQEVARVCHQTPPERRTPEQKKLCEGSKPLFGGMLIPGML